MPRAMRTVADILDTKGRQVYAVSPGDTVFHALELMADKNIGAVVVLEGDNLAGIFSERDYARRVILKGKASRDTPVRNIMTADVICVGPDTLVEVCMELMTEKHIRHLPICDHDKLVGLVSIGDVVNAIVSEQRYVIDQLRAFHMYEQP